MRQGAMLRLLLLLSVYHFGASQRQPYRFCGALLRCLNSNLLCPIYFAYYNCSLEGSPREEPDCGESWVTGRASEYTVTRVAGGVDAEEREFPWTVYVRAGGSRVCGGTIIERDAVVTAAHCISSFVNLPRSVEVGYGSVNRSRLTYITARKVVMHPNYNSFNSDNDIGVLILDENLPLDITTNLRSACLPRQGRAYPQAPQCIVTGWGLLADGGNVIPRILQKAAVPLVARDICDRSYESFPNILVSDRQVCAGYFDEGGIDACQGDSGGPLVCPEGDRWVLYGVVSIGNGCARARFPGVYAFVPQHVNWIMEQLNQR